MELQVNPVNLFRYIPYLVNDYPYNFLHDYIDNCHIDVFYLYLNSLEEFQIKNVWNMLCDEWSSIQMSAKDDRGFKRSKYSKHSLNYIHETISPEKLNELFKGFIQKDTLLAIIVMRTILYHGHPRLR